MKTALVSLIPLLRFLHLASFGGFFFLFLLFPMKSVYTRLGISPEQIETKYSFLVFASALAVFGLYLFINFLQQWKEIAITKKESRSKTKSTMPNWAKYTQWALFGCIIGRAFWEIDLPFDNDELSLILGMANGDISAVSKPFHASTHPLGTYVAYLSMRLFGLGIWSARLPAVLWTVLFTLVFARFCRRNLSAQSSLLITGHFLCSAIVVWYFHSLRGYVPLMTVSFYLFSQAYELVNNRDSKSRAYFWLTLLSLVSLPFCHGFGSLFGIFLGFSLLFWLKLNGPLLNPAHYHRCANFTSTVLLACPLYAVALITSVFDKGNEKYLHVAADSVNAKENIFTAMLGVFGGIHFIQVKLLFLSLLVGLFYKWKKNLLKTDFVFQLLFLFFSFVIIQKALLGTYITARFFLGILPILLVWISESIQLVDWRPLKLSILLILSFSLWVIPLVDGKPSNFQIPRDDFYAFVKESKRYINTFGRECVQFSYSGAEPALTEKTMVEKYYFPSKQTQGKQCTSTAMVHFGWPWQEEKSYTDAQRKIATVEDIPVTGPYQILHSDQNGRFILELKSN